MQVAVATKRRIDGAHAPESAARASLSDPRPAIDVQSQTYNRIEAVSTAGQTLLVHQRKTLRDGVGQDEQRPDAQAVQKENQQQAAAGTGEPCSPSDGYASVTPKHNEMMSAPLQLALTITPGVDGAPYQPATVVCRSINHWTSVRSTGGNRRKANTPSAIPIALTANITGVGADDVLIVQIGGTACVPLPLQIDKNPRSRSRTRPRH